MIIIKLTALILKCGNCWVLKKRNKDEATKKVLFSANYVCTASNYVTCHLEIHNTFQCHGWGIRRYSSGYKRLQKNGKLLYAVSQLADVIQPFPTTLKANKTKSQLLDKNCSTHCLLYASLQRVTSCEVATVTHERSRLMHKRFLHKRTIEQLP
jgi:hypothetical protein